jgi:hypothetical protein
MLRKVLLVIAIGMMVLTLNDCKKDDAVEPDPLAPLVGVWSCTKAARAGVAQDGYDNFKLTLSGTSGATTFGYSAAGRPPLSPWPASGSWKFGTNTATDIVRDTDLPVSYSVTDTQLEVTFSYTGSGFARGNEVSGVWVFTFTK